MKKILNFFAILSTALFLAACGSSGPESVAESFVKNLYEGSASDAVKLVNIPEKEKGTGAETMFTGKIEMSITANKDYVKQAGGIDSYKVEAPTMKDDSNAKITVTITFKDGSTKVENVNVVKINGDWKVQI